MDSNIKSIIVYGSHARKDNDINSDYDICVLTQNKQDIDLDNLREIIGKCESSELNSACYPSDVVDNMLNYGSLFLWHLKLEGKVLFGEDYFTKKIEKLNPFIHHHQEIKYHSQLFEDLLRAWKELTIINEHDLSLLFTIARNTCMILSHKLDKPSFGRLDSFSTAKKLYPDLPLSLNDYLNLEKWKITYERGGLHNYALPGFDEYEKIIKIIKKLLCYAYEKTKRKH